jgi:hypothetical protein
MSPHVAQICTPHKLATEQVMEDKISAQAKEKLAVTGWVQALWEKFTKAVNNKFLTAKEKEVRWVADQPTYSTKAPIAIMEEAAPYPISPEFPLKSCTVKKGSKYWVSTLLERMSSKIKEQERIADSASALALSFWNSGQLPRHRTSPPLPVHAPDSTPVEPATLVQQLCSTRMLASDLATLWQDLLFCSPARPLDLIPSLSTVDSLVSRLSSLTSSAVE